MTTTTIADFSPVTESDVDPYGELFWTEEMSENLSRQWTDFVAGVFYECGEKSVYVNPATGGSLPTLTVRGEVGTSRTGRKLSLRCQNSSVILTHSLTDKNPRLSQHKIGN